MHQQLIPYSARITLLQDGLQVCHLVVNWHSWLPALQQLGICKLRLHGLASPWCCCHMPCCNNL
jgi:hypothetical protein